MHKLLDDAGEAREFSEADELRAMLRELGTRSTFFIVKTDPRMRTGEYAQTSVVRPGATELLEMGRYAVEHRESGVQYQTIVDDLEKVGDLLAAWTFGSGNLSELATWRTVPV
jgi:hypothetical protein